MSIVRITKISQDYILEMNYKDKKGINRSSFVTNDKKLCKGKRPKDKSLDEPIDPNYYTFYDLTNEEYIKIPYSEERVYGFMYPHFNKLGITDTIDLTKAIEEKNPGIKEANKLVLEELKIKKVFFNKLINEAFNASVDFKIDYDARPGLDMYEEVRGLADKPYNGESVLKYNKTVYDGKNCDEVKDLFISDVYDQYQTKFNLIFDITVNEYRNKTYKLENICKKFFEILDIHKKKSIDVLDKEKEEMKLAEASDEDLEEVDSVIDLVSNGVKDCKNTCKDILKQYKNKEISKEDVVESIIKSWPPILFPFPRFLFESGGANMSVFKQSLLKFTNK
jgi:hypothetical protein|tara:strand:+ start:154 stop:1161 length:1008 start_codon:yes stop_codon:yes gene_type:complete